MSESMGPAVARPRTDRRNLEVVCAEPPPSSSNNNASRLMPSDASSESISGQSTDSEQLSRWLSRGSREGRHGDGVSLDSVSAHPIISISPSSSAQSHLSASSSGSTPGKLKTRRSSADSKSTSSASSGNAVSRGFASLSLKTSHSKRHSRQHREELGDWASADLEPPSEGTEADQKSIKSNGSGKFSLRRKGSSLRMFGKGKEREEAGVRSPSPSSVVAGGSEAISVSPNAGGDSRSTSHLERVSTTEEPARSVGLPSTSVASGRIGGWFNSILSSSSSAPLPESSTSPARPSTASSNEPNTSPSKFSISSTGSFRIGGSPTKKRSDSANSAAGSAGGGGRLGPLDRMLDKAVQYFLDTDSTADRCEAEIWVLGVRHKGWEPSTESTEVPGSSARDGDHDGQAKKRKRRSRRGAETKRGGRTDEDREKRPAPTTNNSNQSVDSLSSSSASFASSPSTSPRIRATQPSAAPSSTPPTSPFSLVDTNGWPASFYHDFYSRVALTYRTGFPPIPCSSPSAAGLFNSLSMSIGRGPRGGSNGGDGLSSDTGWGCMLRTGQSLLANALVTVHLGRDWRRSLPPSSERSNATYIRILSLFLDDPSPLSPFSVHRFALMGKQLGKEVGEWFGPSTAAGAIKALVNAFEPAGMSVVSVSDGSIYRSEVEGAARGSTGAWVRPVLILVNLRLGIDGVNPIYHDAVKGIFQFPQSVGVAGGRPSSSYYFVGAQAASLFYIDPHHPRPSIPLQSPSSSELVALAQQIPISLSRPVPAAQHDNDNGHFKESTLTDSFVTVAPSQSSPTTPRHSSAPPLASITRPAPRQPAERVLLDQYYSNSYSDQQLRSYHCDKVRKMPLASLDPSMLVGFLVRDEDDWVDFSDRVRQLSATSKPIFSIADAPPAWMRRPSHTGLPSAASVSIHSTPSSSAPIGGTADDTDDFSEPEDWELDSTDASAASSSAAIPLEGEDWDHSEREPDRNDSDRAVSSGEEIDSIRRVDPDSASWHSASTSPSQPTTLPIAIIESESEEGWEGVSGSPAGRRA